MAQVDTTHEEKPRSAIHTKLDQHKVDVMLDWIAIPTIAIVLLAAFHLHFMLTAGDWDFWTDWKDRRWWPLVTPVVLITFPAAVQYITWEKLRIPFGATLCVVVLTLGMWISRTTQFHIWTYFPMNFIWPGIFIPLALMLDMTLLLTRSYLLTGLFGGFLFGALFYPANWSILAPFHQAVEHKGVLMSLADLQGFVFIRTSTPEYIRIIEEGTLRTFGQHVAPITAFFAAFACILMYFLWSRIGYWFSQSKWLKRI